MLALVDHAFFCYTDRHCIFLDLSRDRYLSVDRRSVENFATHLKEKTAFDENDQAVEAELKRRGLMASDLQNGKDFAPTIAISAITEVATVSDTGPAKPTLSQLRIFFISAMRSEYLLRRLPISEIVTRAKRVRRGNDVDRSESSAEHAAALMRVFRRLRPLFPTDSICLRDSFMAINFLAAFGVHPEWVFGVSGDPFGAHCWLQIGNAVLTEEAAAVRRFRPIMVI